jgi:sugar lactone lactonase YvrE
MRTRGVSQIDPMGSFSRMASASSSFRVRIFSDAVRAILKFGGEVLRSRFGHVLRRVSALGLVAGALTLCAAEPASVTARALARDALADYESKDLRGFLTKMEAAVALRPDYPRLLVNLAAAQAVNGQPETAVATLKQLAALGVHSPVDKSEDFIALRGRDDFKAVCAQLTANLLPIGAGEIAFTLPGMTGLIEGIAWREKTGEFYFGDVHNRCVWVRGGDGKVRRFSEENDELTGVFGLVVDEASGTIWAATSAVPGMRGYTPEQDGDGGLAELDLATGHVRRILRVPKDRKQHVIGDLALSPDGSVLLPDSVASVLWRLAPGGAALENFMESEEFISLQGVSIAPDGKTALVSDYANGLLAVDLVARSVQRVPTPANTTLLGIDGLVRAPDGSVIAIQSGVRPIRILRLTVENGGEAVSQVTVLESAHAAMAEPGLGCIANGDLVFISTAGWSRFENTDNQPTAPRLVPIFRTKLAPPAKPTSPAKR